MSLYLCSEQSASGLDLHNRDAHSILEVIYKYEMAVELLKMYKEGILITATLT